MIAETLVISDRFCGPPRSGNGGYVCGRLARHVEGVAAVRLKAPPPLETPLQIDADGGVVRLRQGDTLLGEARPALLDLSPPAPPSFEQADAATASYLGFRRHEFPRCFVCGPARGEADGLRLFPGHLNGKDLVASPWIPDASLADADGRVAREFLWAALDCPSAFAFLPVAPGKAVLLGELCARIDAVPAVGERCIVTGWPIAQDGRKYLAGSAVWNDSGVLLALGRATWIEVDARAFSEASSVQ